MYPAEKHAGLPPGPRWRPVRQRPWAHFPRNVAAGSPKWVQVFKSGCRFSTCTSTAPGLDSPTVKNLRPLHLRPLHLRPLHLRPLHLRPLHLRPLHLRPLHLRPLHLRPLHLRPLHLRPLHLRPLRAVQKRRRGRGHLDPARGWACVTFFLSPGLPSRGRFVARPERWYRQPESGGRHLFHRMEQSPVAARAAHALPGPRLR